MEVTLYIAVFFPMLSAVLSYLIGRFGSESRRELRNRFACVVTGVEFGLLLYFLLHVLSKGSSGEVAHLPEVCGMGLNLTLDGFRALYGTIAAFMWFMSTLFSREYFGHYRNRNRYYLFLLLTLEEMEEMEEMEELVFLLPFKKRSHMEFFLESMVILNSILVWYLLLHRPDSIFTLANFTGNLSISFAVDGMSMVFGGLVSALWPLATLYALEYMTKEKHEKVFFLFYTITYGVTLGISFAANLLTKKNSI